MSEELEAPSSTGLATWASPVKTIAKHGFLLGAVAAGGALTGYVVGGNKRGAQLGALTNVTIFALLAAAYGQAGGFANSVITRALYGALGVGSAALVWRIRR